LVGCDDGRNGVDGITGIGGCDYDQVRDPETRLCIANSSYVAAKDGLDGLDGLTWAELEAEICGNTGQQLLADKDPSTGIVTLHCVYL